MCYQVISYSLLFFACITITYFCHRIFSLKSCQSSLPSMNSFLLHNARNFPAQGWCKEKHTTCSCPGPLLQHLCSCITIQIQFITKNKHLTPTLFAKKVLKYIYSKFTLTKFDLFLHCWGYTWSWRLGAYHLCMVNTVSCLLRSLLPPLPCVHSEPHFRISNYLLLSETWTLVRLLRTISMGNICLTMESFPIVLGAEGQFFSHKWDYAPLCIL